MNFPAACRSVWVSVISCDGHMDFRHLLRHKRPTLAPVSERDWERLCSLAPVCTGDFLSAPGCSSVAPPCWVHVQSLLSYLPSFYKTIFVRPRKFAKLLIQEGPIFFSHVATLKTGGPVPGSLYTAEVVKGWGVGGRGGLRFLSSA